MKKALILSTAMLALVLAGCSKAALNLKAYFVNGTEELQQAFQAKAAAKSFKMTTKIAAHDENVMETHFEVSCPDRERITMKIGSATRRCLA